MTPVEETASVESAIEHTQSASELATLLHSANTWIAVSFIIFVLLALRYVRPILVKGLDERSGKIREQLEQASRLRAEAEELLKTYRAQQESLLKEAESIIASAKNDAAAMRTQAAEELKANIARRTQQAHEKIARAEVEAVHEIRQRIVDKATEMARATLAAHPADADELAIGRALNAVEKQLA